MADVLEEDTDLVPGGVELELGVAGTAGFEEGTDAGLLDADGIAAFDGVLVAALDGVWSADDCATTDETGEDTGGEDAGGALCDAEL